MSGNPMEDLANSKNVLGLIWDRATDRLGMDVKCIQQQAEGSLGGPGYGSGG
jgi:hypothetical protein